MDRMNRIHGITARCQSYSLIAKNRPISHDKKSVSARGLIFASKFAHLQRNFGCFKCSTRYRGNEGKKL